jgi:hypothetical protein
MLNDKLEIAIYGYDINDPSSVFTYIWNSVGVPIKEEDVRKILGNVIFETVEHEKVDEIVRSIKSQLSWGDIEEGYLDRDYIKEVLRQHGYNDINYIDRLTDLVARVFSSRLANIIPEPEEYADDPSADDPESISLGSRLTGVPKVHKEPLKSFNRQFTFKASKYPFKTSFINKEKIPSLIRRRQEKDPDVQRGDYTVHRTYGTKSEKEAAKLARAQEIARAMRRK